LKQRIILIEPPYLDLYGKSKIAVKPYFPLGLGYIAAVLKKTGNEVRLLVSPNESDFINLVISSIEDFGPDIIGLTSMTSNYSNAVNIAREIKKRLKIPIMIGGTHVSSYRDKILKEQKEFDYIICGEGEDTAAELVESLSNNIKDLPHIKGLIWRSNGKVVTNIMRPLETDLDRIPFPARGLVDIDQFSTHSHIPGGRSSTIITSRGCPFLCIFCSAHLIDGHSVRVHSVDYVLDEIEVLINKYNVKYIFIQDDTFTFKKKRAEEICCEIIKRGLKIRFGCFSRAEVMDESFAKLLKKAGCTNVTFGVESGSETVLKKIKKGTTIERAKTAIQACNKVNLQTTASFVMGFPFDTVETMQQTINFALELNPTLAAFNPLVPFPGSDIFNEDIHAPKTVDGWKKYITVDVPPFSFVKGLTPEDIYKIAQRANRRFYFRPKQLWRITKTIRTATEFKEYVKAGFATVLR